MHARHGQQSGETQSVGEMNTLKNLGSAIASGYGYVTNEVWTFSADAKTDIAKAFQEFKGKLIEKS